MTDNTNINKFDSAPEEEFYKESVEEDGLTVAVDEETDTITFSWNEETHPQWNVLHEYSKEELIGMMYKHLGVVPPAKEQDGEVEG